MHWLRQQPSTKSVDCVEAKRTWLDHPKPCPNRKIEASLRSSHQSLFHLISESVVSSDVVSKALSVASLSRWVVRRTQSGSSGSEDRLVMASPQAEREKTPFSRGERKPSKRPSPRKTPEGLTEQPPERWRPGYPLQKPIADADLADISCIRGLPRCYLHAWSDCASGAR